MGSRDSFLISGLSRCDMRLVDLVESKNEVCLAVVTQLLYTDKLLSNIQNVFGRDLDVVFSRVRPSIFLSYG